MKPVIFLVKSRCFSNMLFGAIVGLSPRFFHELSTGKGISLGLELEI